jgi:uncharacterized SAM-binding protein YcdF (DUF218 family)
MIYILCNIIAICSYSSVYENKQCDVAIVLGAATRDDGVSEVYKQRLNHAIKLYNDNYVKNIIVTVGKGNSNVFSDAFTARDYLISQGIPGEIIILEEESSITQENLENSKKIMDEKGYKTALVVSDPLHMKRAMLLAKDIGITAYSSPTQSSAYKSLGTKIPFVVRETFFYVGYKWYRVIR